MDSLVSEFVVESYENLDQLDRDLVVLEQNPSDHSTLSSIFRTIHTIKGTCGFLGFPRLESVTHAGETLLSRLRDGELTVSPEITSALLACVDAVRQILACIEASNDEGETDCTELRDTLTRLAEGEGEAAVPERTGGRFGELLIKSGLVPKEEVEKALREQEQGDPRRLGEILVERKVLPPQFVADTLRLQEEAHGGTGSSSIRVDVRLLDKLMNLVGELVLARNQILQFTAQRGDPTFLGTSQRLNLITTELQEGVMKTRMQPIGHVWSKFPRVVRDLAVSHGKQVRIEMEGNETELDRTIIESIKDPLTHVVRNSVDHGIETPEQRRARGKPDEGRLFLRACHEGGQVIMEISDDGAGIDLEQLKRKAIQRNLITPEQAGRLSDRELLHLIFLPGFSTAETVTNVSGRGVGMDVVKTNIEKIGGTVDIQSKPGQGTTLRIKIPLTLAIIPALIVTSGGERYAIPQVSLLELVRLEGDQARRGIERIHGAPMYRLRGSLLPLVSLNHELALDEIPGGSRATVVENDLTGMDRMGRTGRTGSPPHPVQPSENSGAIPGAGASPEGTPAVNIVVLQADDRQFGLVVDEINDTEEIVVKPLDKQLKEIPVFAGATIMGDGKVALILDVTGLAQQARVISALRDRALAETSVKSEKKVADRQALLLLGIGREGRMAIPLSMVARLEEFPPTMVERAGTREVVQYRGRILPLVRLAQSLPGTEAEDGPSDEPLQVVVYAEGGRSVGLVVNRILDIVEDTVHVEECAIQDGLLGSAVIQQRVTDLLDVHGLIRSLDPTFFDRPVSGGVAVDS
jgi:two-component system chemotaxis sensor kinase CheA